MTATSLTRLAGVLGGLAWLLRVLADHHGGPAALVNALHWGGLALIAIAVLGIGAGLVSGLPALRVVVAVCLAALVWSVLEVLHDQYADDRVDAVFGVLLVLFCVAGLVRRARRGTAVPDPPAGHGARRSSGSHAA